jgi:hypothetical protein
MRSLVPGVLFSPIYAVERVLLASAAPLLASMMTIDLVRQ